MIQKHNNNKNIPAMRLKMFLYLAAFVVILLVILALFQSVFLPYVYRFTVKSQTMSAVSNISKTSYESNDYETLVYETATKNKLCISIYKIVGNTAEEEYRAHTMNFCLIHSVMREDNIVSNIYSELDNDGKYISQIEQNSSSTAGTLIAAQLVDEGDFSLLIVANSDILPIDATVETLRYELIIISVVLLALAVVMSLYISKSVTSPVVQMNNEAKKLAKGIYEVKFDGGEYKETKELSETLNYAADELSKLDSMQKELISNISHDLRTPLTLISGYSEVMRDIPGEMTKENMQVIIDETARLNSLVNDLLDLSRITGGEQKLNKKVFSITDAITSTVSRYSHLTEKDGYDIQFEFDENVMVNADETLVLQVIYNLINNAINYTGDDKKIIVKQTVNDGTCRISVIDTGEGIPEDKLPLIWDRYYRMGDYHKRSVTGTGLGLSIVKHVLISHNADFGVSSTVGNGSTFWFEMDVVKL